MLTLPQVLVDLPRQQVRQDNGTAARIRQKIPQPVSEQAGLIHACCAYEPSAYSLAFIHLATSGNYERDGSPEMTTTSLLASAKANRNILAAEPQITVTLNYFPVDAEDWQEPAVVASHTGPIGTRQDAILDVPAADEILAALGYRRTSEWRTPDAPNLSPSGQWNAAVEPA